MNYTESLQVQKLQNVEPCRKLLIFKILQDYLPQPLLNLVEDYLGFFLDLLKFKRPVLLPCYSTKHDFLVSSQGFKLGYTFHAPLGVEIVEYPKRGEMKKEIITESQLFTRKRGSHFFDSQIDLDLQTRSIGVLTFEKNIKNGFFLEKSLDSMNEQSKTHPFSKYADRDFWYSAREYCVFFCKSERRERWNYYFGEWKSSGWIFRDKKTITDPIFSFFNRHPRAISGKFLYVMDVDGILKRFHLDLNLRDEKFELDISKLLPKKLRHPLRWMSTCSLIIEGDLAFFCFYSPSPILIICVCLTSKACVFKSRKNIPGFLTSFKKQGHFLGLFMEDEGQSKFYILT